MVLAGAQVAHAQEQCDARFDDWLGGAVQCHMLRSSLPLESTGGVAGQRGYALPNYSEIDLLQGYSQGQMTFLRFDLDAELLDLKPPTSVTRTEYTRMELVELGLFSHTLMMEDPGSYRVLVVSMERRYGSTGYQLKFSWRDPSMASANGSSGANPIGEVNFATADLLPLERKVTVHIEPSDGDWSSLQITAWGEGESDGAGLSTVIGQRWLDLAYDKPQSFGMPPSTFGLALTQPTDLRAGIIGGDLQSVGMTAGFLFYLPLIPNHE
jgi:hypothetical protein